MKREISFVKYHGCGNDFILKDERRGRRTPDKIRSSLAMILCNRHFSVGADGVMFVEPAHGVDGSMRLFEPAGNEADMCGNGLRCVAAYLMEKLHKSEVSILTRDGIKLVSRSGESYRVEMGPVRTNSKDLMEYIKLKGKRLESMSDLRMNAGGCDMRGSLVNSGEPHFVVKTGDVGAVRMREIGDAVNKDKALFPRGVNIDFVEVVGPARIKVRTYERGVYDETLACGTGATASAAVALSKGWVKKRPVKVETVGGCLRVDVDADGTTYMTGPAERVFEGRIRVDV